MPFIRQNGKGSACAIGQSYSHHAAGTAESWWLP
jgi:hypothetical protein